MTEADALNELRLMLPEKGADKIDPMLTKWLLEGAVEVARRTGAYRNTLTPSSTAGLNYVDLASSPGPPKVYDLCGVDQVLYDGTEISLKSFPSMEAWKRENGTDLSGTPVYYALNNAHDPTRICFERKPDAAKTVTIYYFRVPLAFADLPDGWRRHALNWAKEIVNELTPPEDRLVEVGHYLTRFMRFVAEYSFTLKQQKADRDRTPLYNHWLTLDVR
jgi:hypothetical protein